MAYYDRTGTVISLDRWAALSSDPAYRFVQRSLVESRSVAVITMWRGFDPYRTHEDDIPTPEIFEVALFRPTMGEDERGVRLHMPTGDQRRWLMDERYTTQHVTEASATERHNQLVREIETG